MARFEFKLPDIGEGIAEGEVVNWLVGVGDAVTENQDVVEVMTDKATVTIGAPKEGRVTELRAKAGDVVGVGSVLVVFDVAEATGLAGSAAAPVVDPASGSPKPQQDTIASAVGDIQAELAGTELIADPVPAQPEQPAVYLADKPLASPAVRALARKQGIDLRRVVPTGKSGQVTREDLEKVQHSTGLARSTAARSAAAVPIETSAAPGGPLPLPAGASRTAIRGLRKRIFENMARSKHTAAHFTYVDECDVTALLAVHERASALAAEQGVKLSYLPFIVKAVVGALRKHPELHVLVDDSALELVQPETFDIGIAMATEAGLIVPVLRGADRLSMLDLAREIGRLATAARAGKTRPEDLGGSCFSITSLGKQAGLFATPVINYPEVAILSVHQIKKRPVVRSDTIAIGEVMLLSFSFDHRIIDGHVGAAFAQEIIRYLERPDLLLIDG
ncbi:MAG: 2-oxo acid dehydrogenase subunit E2 [Polyangiaceae bacterium]|nr:2-oxo acid dehydrogenase subunit E2 [Polyangiaceae bacterium]